MEATEWAVGERGRVRSAAESVGVNCGKGCGSPNCKVMLGNCEETLGWRQRSREGRRWKRSAC